MASFTINAILGHSPPNYNKANDSVPPDEAYETTTDITEAGLCLYLSHFFCLAVAKIVHVALHVCKSCHDRILRTVVKLFHYESKLLFQMTWQRKESLSKDRRRKKWMVL